MLHHLLNKGSIQNLFFYIFFLSLYINAQMLLVYFVVVSLYFCYAYQLDRYPIVFDMTFYIIINTLYNN